MSVRDLEMVRCGLDNFNHTDKEEMILKGIENYQCIKNKSEFFIGGTFLADTFELLAVAVKNCRNSSDSNVTCKPLSDQDLFFSFNELQIRVVNQYYDKDDIEYPIKSYIKDSLYFPLVPGFKSLTDIEFMISSVNEKNSLLPFSSGEDM